MLTRRSFMAGLAALAGAATIPFKGLANAPAQSMWQNACRVRVAVSSNQFIEVLSRQTFAPGTMVCIDNDGYLVSHDGLSPWVGVAV